MTDLLVLPVPAAAWALLQRKGALSLGFPIICSDGPPCGTACGKGPMKMEIPASPGASQESNLSVEMAFDTTLLTAETVTPSLILPIVIRHFFPCKAPDTHCVLISLLRMCLLDSA